MQRVDTAVAGDRLVQLVLVGRLDQLGHLALESRLQKSFRELLQQTSLTGQLQAFSLSPARQLLDRLVIDCFGRLCRHHARLRRRPSRIRRRGSG